MKQITLSSKLLRDRPIHLNILYRIQIFSKPKRKYATFPNVVQPSFWLSIIPKPLRMSRIDKQQIIKGKEWNSSTFFIIMFLLIGSNSIQMMTTRKSYDAFSRRIDARIELLKQVIEKVKNGEKVSVETILGTGDAEKEREWKDVIESIENDVLVWDDSPQQDLTHDGEINYKIDDNKAIKSSSNSSTKIENLKVPPGFF